MNGGQRILILGGAGMVGLQVAREAARELHPSEIIISALTRAEVDDAIAILRGESEREGWTFGLTAAPGDIFIPAALQDKPRGELVRDPVLFEELFRDIFAPDAVAYENSFLRNMLAELRPDVVVDCINTATAISYQDVYTTARRVKVLLDRFAAGESLAGGEKESFVSSVRELMVAQGVPQITRHIVVLQRALQDSGVSVYVKVGTTGTGGMGINIPYTHSEDRPSATLLSKSAIGFAHTGLLFLLARTPASASGANDGSPRATMIKEIKPGAMIGFRRLGDAHVRLTGASGRREPAFLLTPREEPLLGSIDPRRSFDEFPPVGGASAIPVRMVGADTGENGFFSIGEFQAITYPRQMEYVTPEEVARTVVLEILGSSTGRDVISAIDGAITEPSYRAGVLRDRAIQEMVELEAALQATGGDVLPSIAVGHLGPPRLSKLLIEAWLLAAALGTRRLDEMIAADALRMETEVERWLEAHPRIASLIATIGIGVLRERDGAPSLTRGPRLNIPVPSPDGSPVALDDQALERWAYMGWVDLRASNFTRWRERLARIAESRPDIAAAGSAAFDRSRYLPRDFVPGEVVGWLLTNETDEMGMPLHRIL
ncbi:MAG TPA: hypothetical protein VMS56_08475 [Thermoanaerobaculia bacterium]|nr:hypothetical protein [Thermoanaerobaculia bacterium]